MTIPEYDEECDCDLCKQLRNERNLFTKPTDNAAVAKNVKKLKRAVKRDKIL